MHRIKTSLNAHLLNKPPRSRPLRGAFIRNIRPMLAFIRSIYAIYAINFTN